MNPHHNSNQDPTIASILQQVNSLIYQQTYNGSVGGLYPNNRPIDAPSRFMNFSNQPIPLRSPTDQFPNGIGGFNPQHNYNPFPPKQFNSSQQQGQFFANNSMNHPVYHQNVGRPLQLQNPNYAQYHPGNFPMFQIHNKNTTSHQNPGFPASQQFGMSNFSGSSFEHGNQGQQRFHSPSMDVNLSNMGQQLQGNQFQPNASGSVQTQKSHNFHATPNNLQNHISQGVGPQSHSFPMNDPIRHGNQGQQRFVSQQGSLYSLHASTSVKAHTPPTITNFKSNIFALNSECYQQDKKGTLSQPKNFTGNKKNHTSCKGSSVCRYKSQFQHAKHVKNGNMNKEGKSNASVNSHPRNSTKFKKKKVCSFNYMDEEVKQWREDRKKNYPTSVKKSKEEKTSMLHCKPQITSDSGHIRICTLNVGRMDENKLMQLTDALRKRKLDIACIQETKWKGAETTECNGYNLWYASLENTVNGVGVLLSKNLIDNVVEVRRCFDRIISIKVVVEKEVVHVISAYAPHPTLEESKKMSFWESLDDIVKGIPINECIFLGGDFNGHIGKDIDGYETVHGGLGHGTRNEEGHRLLGFATAHDLVVSNSFFKKNDAHLITFQSEGKSTQNDYLLLRKRHLSACIDCKVLPGEISISKHRLLIMDLYMSMIKRIAREEMKELHAKQAQLACEAADLFIPLPKRPHLKGQVRVCTINVGTLNDKLLKLTNALRKRKVEIACIQETKWKGEEATLECNGYKLWHAGLENAINGVGILISTNLKDNVVEVKRCCDRIIAIKVAVERKIVNVVCVYAPNATLEDSFKRSFWESLDDIVKGIPMNECIFLGGDFNGHIGKKADGYETVHGGFGFGTRNDEGHRLLEFATAHDLVVANSFYKKRDAHLITFHNEGYNSQNDYLLLRKWDRKACIDCKALPGETSASQHKLLFMDLYMSMKKRIKRNPNRKKHKKEQLKKGKLHNKRGKTFQNDRIAKKAKTR
ncbi:uncharacterized protein LOC111914831 isoform X1 [Lactuca sativa]|uniref:uncharacterized protein LOC111914831 isoform X1 n=1 Tax=Lactuca sativa TaxID=4236 RepID=UPI000CD8CED4|nr:uncharacterized protein LOC111914831 isoform X1 [Lactuca sativa]